MTPKDLLFILACFLFLRCVKGQEEELHALYKRLQLMKLIEAASLHEKNSRVKQLSHRWVDMFDIWCFSVSCARILRAHSRDAFIDEDPLASLGDLYLSVDQGRRNWANRSNCIIRNDEVLPWPTWYLSVERFFGSWGRQKPNFSAKPETPQLEEEVEEVLKNEKPEEKRLIDEQEKQNLDILGEGWPYDSSNTYVSEQTSNLYQIP